MLSKPLVIICVLALISLFAVSSAKADSVPIVNANFSQLGAPLTLSCGTGCAYNDGPITGWAYSGAAEAGSWQPNSSFYTSLPPAETTIAYINGGKLTQDVGALLANTTYALTVYVGNRLDNLTTDYSFGLATGPLVDATWSNNGLITPGTFQAETISFTTGSNVTGDLTIFLADAGPQADFGNVSLNAVSTPESSSLLMLGIGLIGLLFVGKRFGLKRPEQLTATN
ncbi:MAG TPA: PEP-CTERM sorting domain-containing protein [Terriglobales bacterium]|nr:PEP-CTERM sorting domain-containing protein [Terriglobales bacterium]